MRGHIAFLRHGLEFFLFFIGLDQVIDQVDQRFGHIVRVQAGEILFHALEHSARQAHIVVGAVGAFHGGVIIARHLGALAVGIRDEAPVDAVAVQRAHLPHGAMRHGHFHAHIEGGGGGAPVGGIAFVVHVHGAHQAVGPHLFQQLEGFDVFIAGQAQGEVGVHGHFTAVGGRREDSPVVGINEEGIGALGQLGLQLGHVGQEGIVIPFTHLVHFAGIIFHARFLNHAAVEHQALGAGKAVRLEAVVAFAHQTGILKQLGNIQLFQGLGDIGQRIAGGQLHHPHGGEVVGHMPSGRAAGNGEDPFRGHLVPGGGGGVEFEIAVVGLLERLVAGQPFRLVHFGAVFRVGVHGVPHTQLDGVALQVVFQLFFGKRRGNQGQDKRQG